MSAASAPSSGRDLRFDSLRGLLVVTMAVNHLPSLFRVATDEWFGIFSSAEGFVFISGLLAGWVYTRRLRKEGQAGLRAAAVHRSTLIYIWHVAAYLTALIAVQIGSHLSGFCSWTTPKLFYAHPLLAVVLGSSMLYQPGLLDILPMYCVFVLMLPILLQALERGRGGWALLLSALPWLAVQWAPPIDGAPLYPIHVGSFNLFAWQFLFVAGAVIGHGRMRPDYAFRPRLGWLIPASAVAFCGWGIQHLHWRPACSDVLFGDLINKPVLGPIRLVNFAAAAYLVACLATWFPRLFRWPPFALLGRHSLAIVAAQSVVVMIVLQFDTLFATTLSDVITTSCIVAFLFAVAWVHEAMGGTNSNGFSGLFRARQSLRLPLSRRHDAHTA